MRQASLTVKIEREKGDLVVIVGRKKHPIPEKLVKLALFKGVTAHAKIGKELGLAPSKVKDYLKTINAFREELLAYAVESEARQVLKAVKGAAKSAKTLEAVLKGRSSYKALIIYDAYLKNKLSLSQALSKLTSKDELAALWKLAARVDWLPWSENYLKNAPLSELRERLHRALS